MKMSEPAALLRNEGSDLVFALVRVRDQCGMVFKGRGIDSYCFVPRECVYSSGPGRVAIDEIRYFLSGWSIRNMRAAKGGESTGCLLFPEPDHLVSDLEAPAARQFLRRIAGEPA